MAASTRRARRGGPRAAPEPAPPPIWLLREDTDLASLKPSHVGQLLENVQGMGRGDRRARAPDYLAILRSEDPAARSGDGLSKKQIVDKLELCIEAYWKTYDEAMGKFREQNVEVPPPAAVAPEPDEDYDALGADALRNLVTAREARKWAQNQSLTYGCTAPAMRDLLRDQAADPSQWAIVAQHEAPAPKYVEETVSQSLTKGALDADTWKKWLRELTVGPAIEVLESVGEARIVIRRTLPTLENAKGAGSLREALAERLERPATANDVKDALLDAADELREAWGERKMVPDGYEGVTVEDLRGRLEATEARAMRRACHELGELSEERQLELGCNDMYYACAVTLRNWSRDLAVALGVDGVADYAKKAADLKHDHHGGLGCIRDVSAAVATRIRNGRRGLQFREESRSEIRNNTLAMRRARYLFHRLAVTSGDVLGWD